MYAAVRQIFMKHQVLGISQRPGDVAGEKILVFWTTDKAVYY